MQHARRDKHDFKLVSTREQQRQQPLKTDGRFATVFTGDNGIDEERGNLVGWGVPALCCFVIIGGLLGALSIQEVVFEQRKEAALLGRGAIRLV